ncbi:MAG TPA: radical SAM protein, partial [Methanomicrobiales archaeon]|nr:radical SAM protein [Methanomicrobiales archaeon]
MRGSGALKYPLYFSLPERRVLVPGAKYSILVDFKTSSIQQMNGSRDYILALVEEGHSIPEVLDLLGPSPISEHIPSSVNQSNHDSICPSSGVGKLNQIHGEERPDTGLEFLWIEVTSRCNLRCLHCYAGSGLNGKDGLSFGSLTRVIDQAAEMGCRCIQFTGGECLLRDDLTSLVNHALIRRIPFIEVFTNGTLLSEDLINFFALNGVHVAISLHSYKPEIHDEITGVKGS